MKRGPRKNRGAVTVIVTLLLIPAVLITGTGVDIARIYTSRATLQDANQLALNSVLADYDALLQDLYGLYAVTQTDAALGKMVDEYVQKAVFAPDVEQKETGALKLFYGSDMKAELTAGNGQNLGDTDQLRRQIEEYSKLRVPVVLVNELLDRITEFKKVKADSEVIDKKTEVENHIDSIDKIYREIYEAINEVADCQQREADILDDVNSGLGYIREQLEQMREVRDEFEEVVGDSDRLDDESEQLDDHYQDLAGNIVAIMKGSAYGSDWEENIENPAEGDFTAFHEYSMTDRLEEGSSAMKEYKSRAEKLNSLCQKANEEKAALEQAIRDLESELNKGECSESLKNGITEPAEGETKSLLQQYKDLVDFDLEKLGNDYMGAGGKQLGDFKDLMDGLLDNSTPVYASDSEDGGVSYRYNFLTSRSRILDEFLLNYNLSPSDQGRDDMLQKALKAGVPQSLLNPGGGYKNFQQTSEDHQKFYDVLAAMYGSGESDKKKEDQTKESALAVFNTLKEMFSGIYPDPEGAHIYTSSANTSGAPTGSDFCNGDADWGDTTKVKKSLQQSLNSDIISKMGDLAGSAANKLLLLGYATEMFSCYSTGRGNDTNPVNMAGIPLSIDVNYYYQSELEYIYNGNLANAIDNVNSLGSMILLTRFVMNYIVSFTIRSVNDIVRAVRAALSFLGPVAIVIAELVRLGLALGESFTDLSRLRNGHKVALMKDEHTWRFSLSGFETMTAEAAQEKTKESVAQNSALDDDTGIYYFDYVRIFLLFVNGDEMAERVKNLIALNMTNKTQGIGAKGSREERETAMSAAQLFDMSKAITGFSLTLTADVGMLFLSMPFAQKGVNKVIPPKTLTLQTTDYRGY